MNSPKFSTTTATISQIALFFFCAAILFFIASSINRAALASWQSQSSKKQDHKMSNLTDNIITNTFRTNL